MRYSVRPMKRALIAFQYLAFGVVCGAGNLFLFLGLHGVWDPGRAIVVGTTAMMVLALVDRHSMGRTKPH
jgi:hypothetical protein